MSGLAAPIADTVLGPALRDGIKRLSLREQIASSLADLIAAGLLQTGDELPAERDLAVMLEVSRDSVRGALHLLAERGILDIGHGTRTRVRTGPATVEESRRFDLRQLPDLTDEAVIEARRLLEPDLTRRAAERIDQPTLSRLSTLIAAQHDMQTDPVRFQISDREFHLAIFKAAGNPVLIGFASQAYAYAYAYRRELMRHHDGIPIAIRHHEHIFEALEARDPDAAAAAMCEHIETIAKLLEAVDRTPEIKP